MPKMRMKDQDLPPVKRKMIIVMMMVRESMMMMMNTGTTPGTKNLMEREVFPKYEGRQNTFSVVAMLLAPSVFRHCPVPANRTSIRTAMQRLSAWLTATDFVPKPNLAQLAQLAQLNMGHATTQGVDAIMQESGSKEMN